MTERARSMRLPPHVLVMLGASTAGYAIALAAVAGAQSAAEAALVDERAPYVAGLDTLASGHDALADRLEEARRRYESAAGRYGELGDVLQAVDAQLATLATIVAEVDGVSRDLPTSVRMPVIRAVTKASAPTTHATTGASGG